MFSLYWLTREWALLHPVVGKTWELPDWQRLSPHLWTPYSPFSSPHPGRTSNRPFVGLRLEAFAFLSQNKKLLFQRVNAPFEDCGG